jgi:hypothetical protein
MAGDTACARCTMCVNRPYCPFIVCLRINRISENSTRNTTKGILAKDGVGLSELHVSAFYSGHHQVKSLILRGIKIC